MLTLIHQRGTMDEVRFISESLMREMTRRQSAAPTRTYGLGVVILNRPEISPRQLLGHQGFAYGCVDGAFIEEKRDARSCSSTAARARHEQGGWGWSTAMCCSGR